MRKKSIISPPNKYYHCGVLFFQSLPICIPLKKNPQTVVHVLLSRGVSLVGKTNVSSRTALPGSHLASHGNLEI